jgi:hypothetical protein
MKLRQHHSAAHNRETRARKRAPHDQGTLEHRKSICRAPQLGSALVSSGTADGVEREAGSLDDDCCFHRRDPPTDTDDTSVT